MRATPHTVACLVASLVDAALGGEKDSSFAARIRVRCFPPRLRDVVLEALEARPVLGGSHGWETCARVDDATHALDVVAVRGRAHVTVWSLDRTGPDSLRAWLMDAGEAARKRRTDAGAMCRAFHKIEEATGKHGEVRDGE